MFQQTIYLARHQYLISLFIIFLLVKIKLYSPLRFTGTLDVNFVLLVPSGILGQSFMDSSLSIWQNIQDFLTEISKYFSNDCISLYKIIILAIKGPEIKMVEMVFSLIAVVDTRQDKPS